MVPMHIDRINHMKLKCELPPGPGIYETPRTFGKAGKQQSFGLKLHLDDISLRRSMALPGPGDYTFPDSLQDKFSLI